MTFPTIHPAILPELSLSDPVAKANILLNAFRVTINGGLSVFNMVDGVVDEFEDETGVTTKTGASYDASGDYYHNPGSESMVSQGTGTAIGDMTSGGGLAAAFNGNKSLSWTTGARGPVNAVSDYCGKDWGVDVTRNISRYKTWGGTTYGYSAGSNVLMYIELYGSNSAPSNPSDGTLLGSASFTDNDTTQPQDVTTGITPGDYRYHWITCRRSSGMDSQNYSEIEFYEIINPADMTLISDPYTASAEPDEAFIVIWEEDVDTPTLNTDLKAWASCDGSTFAQATLTEVATVDSGRILTGTADVSGQTGTTMKWKITTHNNKELKVHAVGLEWS
jgi:hypothetical protein